MKINDFEQELVAYNTAFNDFVVEKHQLPGEWFRVPDHVAIKCADPSDYIETVHNVAGSVDSDGIWELSEGGRKLASARLMGGISLGHNHFSWLEIMQPRPGKESDTGFVEHAEFFFRDFADVKSLLKSKGIDYRRQENPGHAWINIPIDNQGREIKLNNKTLAEVTEWEKQQGILTKIVLGDAA